MPLPENVRAEMNNALDEALANPGLMVRDKDLGFTVFWRDLGDGPTVMLSIFKPHLYQGDKNADG